MKALNMIVVFLFAMSSAFAEAILVYRVGNFHVAFVKIDGLVVNQSCADKKCLAYKKGIQFKSATVPNELLHGGKNPQAVKCKALLGGKVLIGRDPLNNEQSFCVFSDDSYLR